jgi:hypothetical protein
LLGQVACSTQPQQPEPAVIELTRYDNRWGISTLQLGDATTTVDTNAAARYNAMPRCENRRVPIADTRKAFGLRICEYKPEASVLHEAPVVRVVTYSLDDSLVRLDIDTKGDQASYSAAIADVNKTWFNGEKRTLTASNRDEMVWRSGQDEMGISHHTAQSQTEYRIIDTRLAQSLPWLAR